MMIILFCLLFLVIILYLHECVKNMAIRKEILYVKERIAEIACTGENGYILIPSENKRVKELVAQINCSLDIINALNRLWHRCLPIFHMICELRLRY